MANCLYSILAPPTQADYEKHESAEISLIAMDMVNSFITDPRFRNWIKETEYDNNIMRLITDVSEFS